MTEKIESTRNGKAQEQVQDKERTPPTIPEIVQAIKNLARNQSPGIDNLPAELFKKEGRRKINSTYT